MALLFEIDSERAVVRWVGPNKMQPKSQDVHPGRLRVIPTPGVNPIVRPSGFPEYVAGEAPHTEGPPLFEQTTYHVYVHPKNPARVELRHRDPTLIDAPSAGQRGDLLASVNFGSQVGFSRFAVFVDGEPELDFEVEVFPSKVDYKTDYEQMLAEISDFLTGLALEYLRATYRPGMPVRAPEPSDIEWLTILRQVWVDLERALLRIRRQPARRLIREERSVRPERIRRIDSSVRRAVIRGQGRGGRHSIPRIGMIREHVDERRPIETLDTPEHRWLRAQLQDIRYRLAGLIRAETGHRGDAGSGSRREAALKELRKLEERISYLLKLEPLAEATGEPPPNFSSLVLQAAPGYREAYASCLILRLGLRLEGGPLNLSLKDIAALYEYWCYLSVLKILSEEMGSRLDPKDLFRVTSRGLKIDLERGVTKQVVLENGKGKGASPTRVALSYNPSYPSATTPHRPDVGLAISIDSWKTPFEIILDAKYRLDTTPEYQARYGSPGPPEDAVNALHRYRDAILIPPSDGSRDDDAVLVAAIPKRRVVLGAVLFPFQGGDGEFEENRFWKSLEQVGIGAMPFLPSQRDYVQGWLRDVLRQTGWSFADRAIDHWSTGRRAQWMREASEPALIAVLRPGINHLEWIKQNKLYYAPLNALGPRRFAAKWIAFYQGRRDRGSTGAITHEAAIKRIDVKSRREIRTPWPARNPRELQIVYELGEVRELGTPIEISSGMRWFRWASRLSLNRARHEKELYLETEPEWRLYDELCAHGFNPGIFPGDIRVVDPDDIKGRATIEVTNGKTNVRIRFCGAAGFRIDNGDGSTYVPTVQEVLAQLKRLAS